MVSKIPSSAGTNIFDIKSAGSGISICPSPLGSSKDGFSPQPLLNPLPPLPAAAPRSSLTARAVFAVGGEE